MFLTESLVKHPPTPRVLESDLGIIILIIGSAGDSNTPGVGGRWTDHAQHCKPILSQVGPPRSPPALHRGLWKSSKGRFQKRWTHQKYQKLKLQQTTNRIGN